MTTHYYLKCVFLCDFLKKLTLMHCSLEFHHVCSLVLGRSCCVTVYVLDCWNGVTFFGYFPISIDDILSFSSTSCVFFRLSWRSTMSFIQKLTHTVYFNCSVVASFFYAPLHSLFCYLLFALCLKMYCFAKNLTLAGSFFVMPICFIVFLQIMLPIFKSSVIQLIF